MSDPPTDGLALRIEQARDVKASRIVRWLLRSETTCRGCGLPIRRNQHGEWVDAPHHDDPATRGTTCRAPVLVERRLRLPHRPDQWTVERLQAADPGERDRIRRAAGVERKCSAETWARVVALYGAAVAARGGGDGMVGYRPG